MLARLGVGLSRLALFATIAAVPLLWRPVVDAWAPPEQSAPPSYLPAVEARHAREPFDHALIDGLKQDQPAGIIIGDSMAGRVDPVRLGELLGGKVSTLVAPSTGSGWWFLAFKNVVIPSGVTPKWVFVFGRDTNFTDPMFRLLAPYRTKLDWVARDTEPELNEVVGRRLNGPWHRVHTALDRAYAVSRAREWIEPGIAPWLARVAVGHRQRKTLLTGLNEAFGLAHLRPIVQADMAAADDRDADFAANIDESLLPAWVRLTREHGLHVVFIKVLRRPVDGHPPPESPALQQYTKDLRAWLEARGLVLFDDRDDPEMARLPYADGDHVDSEGMTPYAERLAARLEAIRR